MIEHPKNCEYCQIANTNTDHWYWQKHIKSITHGGYWKCKQQNRDNVKEWRQKNSIRLRIRSHYDYDRKHNFKHEVTIEWYTKIIQEECFYCECKPADGIDRKDSSRGHEKSNCIPCCAKCNIILGNIPFQAKLELKAGLKNIFEKRLFKQWRLPGQMPKRKYKDRAICS